MKRRKTREVFVGSCAVGGQNPVRIQSMTTSNTRDVDATVEQAIRLYDLGCEIVRVTVQGKKEAEACEAIKNTLIKKGFDIPLVADIHFYPPAAMEVIEFVDKVRINPGNFLDKRATFKQIEYTDQSYQEELLRIEEVFLPLVEKAKRLKKSLRIGTNHGSLSDRILSRYGDTPKGMVESAFEYARVCRKQDFHDLIFSMKSSNPLVMIHAYRLLAHEMDQMGWDYPLHLGVTEAGEGEDGRVKSAIGIGSLLLEGLGDTIRVSLTEDPWYEIDPCQRLVAVATPKVSRQPPVLKKSVTYSDLPSPLHRDGTVGLISDGKLEGLGKNEASCADFVIGKGVDSIPGICRPQDLNSIVKDQKFVPFAKLVETLCVSGQDHWEKIRTLSPKWILLSLPQEGRLELARRFFEFLNQEKLQIPVILNFSYEGLWEDVVIQASAECGSLLCDGYGQGIVLEGPFEKEKLRILSFNILQGSRRRSFKTEFISCPSCGRTLFHLQEVSERIRKQTGHIPGLKIAIMGCIVNGPGEMADADFGYVGSKSGKVDLYVGKTCVEKNIDHLEADAKLIALIKEHNRWEEPAVCLQT
jgi:(E)-4-hydroxy-3-methylbut-2-enyl-diphosphate synthase